MCTPSRPQQTTKKKQSHQSKQNPPSQAVLSPTSAPSLVSPPPRPCLLPPPPAHIDLPSVVKPRTRKRQRHSSSSSVECSIKKTGQSLPSLVVSISRTLLSHDTHGHSTVPAPTKARKRKLSVLASEKNHTGVVAVESLVVRIPMDFRRPVSSPASTDHRVPEHQHPLNQDSAQDGMAKDFSLAVGAADQVIPRSSSLGQC